MEKGRYFKLDWVLIDEIAIGRAPKKTKHLQVLKEEGIKSVFSLCNEEEFKMMDEGLELFHHARYPLPDHRSARLPTPEEIINAIKIVEDLIKDGPVFIHCIAAMERSPLVCLAWLVNKKQLNPTAALDYLMQVHPGTNPLPGQLNLLNHPLIKLDS